LAKADEGTVQYAFDHEYNFTVLSFAPKKSKRVVFLSTMHSGKKERERERWGYGKRRNKRILQPGKGWCGQS